RGRRPEPVGPWTARRRDAPPRHDGRVRPLHGAPNPDLEPTPRRFANKDGNHECEYGEIPYTSTLKKDATVPIVFVSPVLVSEVAEQFERLRLVRDVCELLVDTYNF